MAAIAALGLTALAAPAALANFHPEAGTYIDHSTSNGHRLTFDYAHDTGTVHHFALSGITIFHSAPVSQTTSGWQFYHRDGHYIAHGTWLNLPNAKPLEGPWTGAERRSRGGSVYPRDQAVSLQEGEALKGLKALMCAGAVAGVIAATGGGAAAPPAAAQTTCAPPAVDGFTVLALTESGVGCHHASELAIHLIRHGTSPADWTCRLTIGGGSGRQVTQNCVHHHFPDRTLRLVYFVH